MINRNDEDIWEEEYLFIVIVCRYFSVECCSKVKNIVFLCFRYVIFEVVLNILYFFIDNFIYWFLVII